MGIAGDQLVKRLLERTIVPAFADAVGLEEEDVQLLFGPEVPKNRGFSAQRIDWINRMFVPSFAVRPSAMWSLAPRYPSAWSTGLARSTALVGTTTMNRVI